MYSNYRGSYQSSLVSIFASIIYSISDVDLLFPSYLYTARQFFYNAVSNDTLLSRSKIPEGCIRQMIFFSLLESYMLFEG